MTHPVGGAGPKRLRVFLVDDHPLVRQGLRQLVGLEADMEVVGEAESASAALRQIEALRPDIATVDIALKESSGIELVKDIRVRCPEVQVVVVSMHEESFYAERVLRAGAGAYVMKDEPPDTVVQAIRQVAAGQMRLSARMSSRLLNRLVGRKTRDTGTSVDLLSDRELEVFEMIGRGLGSRQIAGVLHISIKTVEAHRENIKRQLNVADATDLMQHAIRWVLQENPS